MEGLTLERRWFTGLFDGIKFLINFIRKKNYFQATSFLVRLVSPCNESSSQLYSSNPDRNKSTSARRFKWATNSPEAAQFGGRIYGSRVYANSTMDPSTKTEVWTKSTRWTKEESPHERRCFTNKPSRHLCHLHGLLIQSRTNLHRLRTFIL